MVRIGGTLSRAVPFVYFAHRFALILKHNLDLTGERPSQAIHEKGFLGLGLVVCRSLLVFVVHGGRAPESRVTGGEAPSAQRRGAASAARQYHGMPQQDSEDAISPSRISAGKVSGQQERAGKIARKLSAE
jgi:hypothetical protein